MYTIGWQDINGALYTAQHDNLADAAVLIRIVQCATDLRGVGVQVDTIDQLLALVAHLDGEVPFDGELLKPAFSYIPGAVIEFGISNPCVRAPFMEVHDEQVEQLKRR